MSTAHHAARPMAYRQAQLRPSATHNPSKTSMDSRRHVHQFHVAGPTLEQPTARSTYPKFLSVQETALLQLRWAFRGLLDSLRWDIVVRTVASDAEIRANVYKSLVLNSLSLFSIYAFDLLLQPFVRDQQKWFHRNIGWFYQVLWLLPVVGASLYLNGTWCTTIANRTYLLQHGGRPVASPSSSSWQTPTYTGILRSIATSAYRFVMVCTSVVLGFVLGMVPFVGPTVEFGFMCWVDAYYCFEFVWISRGYSLSSRIRHLEERWSYYFAFGLSSTALCMWGSTLANVALFALIFPAYIIMAMHAFPYPSDPYNPLLSTSSPSKANVNPTICHPSPFIPVRIPVFAVVIQINDAIVRLLNFIGARPIMHPTDVHKPSPPKYVDRSGRRRRAGSDAESSVEGGWGGFGMEMETKNSSSLLIPSAIISKSSTAAVRRQVGSGEEEGRRSMGMY